MSVKKLMPRIIEDIDPPFGPVAVMKYDNDGLYVPVSDYATLLDRHTALREAVAWEREAETAWYSDSLPLTARALHELHENFTAARAEVDRLLEEG